MAQHASHDSGTPGATDVGRHPPVPHRVVVIGGGFGGLETVTALRRLPVDVTLIDRHNYHLFQPLSYQVSTAALAPDEIAEPLRAIFRRNQGSPTYGQVASCCSRSRSRNVRVLMGEVTELDRQRRVVVLRPEVASSR